MESHDGQYGLVRALGPFRATTLVLGSVVGSGVFVSAASMARVLPSGWTLLAVWALAGLMTVLGALTQAELCSRMPVTGGLYSYFRTVFGDAVGFYYGWANLMIAGSGAIAAVAFVFASCAGQLVPLWREPELWREWAVQIPGLGTLHPGAGLGEKMLGAALIVFLSILNSFGLGVGSRVQSLSSVAKTSAIALIVVAAFCFAHDGSWAHLARVPTAGAAAPAAHLASFGALLAALGSAFWAYDGWGNPAYLGGEIRDPQRNLPRAILLGLGLVTALYLIVNLAYLYVLPLPEIARARGDLVASSVMTAVLGPRGAAALLALICLTTFDTLNSAIMSNARVYLAMGRDGLLWRRAGDVHPVSRAPVVALALQGAWSIVLLVSGSFELVIRMYVFVNWLFYLLIPAALVVVRRTASRSNAADPVFKVPAYPLVPLLFAALAAVYLAQTLWADVDGFRTSLTGVLLVGLGTPLLLSLKRSRR